MFSSEARAGTVWQLPVFLAGAEVRRIRVLAPSIDAARLKGLEQLSDDESFS